MVKSAETNCESTEDLLARIEECNNQKDLTDSRVLSMDVKALYPSIDIDFATEIAGELLKESNIIFENVNAQELGLFLSLFECEGKIPLQDGVKEFCPKLKYNRRRPTITGSGCYK